MRQIAEIAEWTAGIAIPDIIRHGDRRHSRAIEIDLREALGDVNVPAPCVPVDYCLT